MQVFVDVFAHQAVVLLLTVSMDVITAGHAADIAIELRADVVEFVQDRDHLFAECLVLKPRQIKSQDIEAFPRVVVKTRNRPGSAVAFLRSGTAFKAKRGELGLKSMEMRPAGLCESDEDLIHVDVLKDFQTVRNVNAQRLHRDAEVEARSGTA